MLNIIGRLLRLADDFAGKIKWAIFFGFMEGIFFNFPIGAILYILSKAVTSKIQTEDILICSILVLVGLLGQYIFRRLVYRYQDATGYEIFERERIRIGDRLKRFPMGYFSEGNFGNLTAVVTSDISFVEMWAMNALYKVVNGYVSMFIGSIFLLVLHYQIALISIIVYVAASIIRHRIQVIGKKQSYIKQKTQAALSGAVLEYVQGISVIKAFNMAGDRAKVLKNTFKDTRDHAIDFEERFIPPNLMYDVCFYFGIAITIFGVSHLYIKEGISLSVMLMLIIFIFQLYLPTKALGLLTAKMRVMNAALDRYEAVKNVKIIDEHGRHMNLDNHDIVFDNVTFAYEEKDVLKSICFRVPQRSMTALVGSSGCGKTTIVNLIARFWDVQKGAVKVGGIDVKEMTCDSLLQNMSMVFQKVYLFHDSIRNNITFGKPDATMEEIIEACKKARCHDFIMALDKGYDTIVGEGGSTLSGGEKQRISIARAILKDAPIVLLDEATASVDPDNEKYIQMAINELVKDKTLVVIAHRLSTIKNADQIVVLDQGRIVEKGVHQALIQQKGAYYDFWQRRMKARSWKIKK